MIRRTGTYILNFVLFWPGLKRLLFFYFKKNKIDEVRFNTECLYFTEGEDRESNPDDPVEPGGHEAAGCEQAGVSPHSLR